MASAFRNGNIAVEDFLNETSHREEKEDRKNNTNKRPAAAGEKQGLSLELRDVAKSFGDKSVLRDIRLSVKEGEFIAIVGRSGCGKSTLLRLIAGLDGISGGTLVRGGQPVDGIGPDTRFMFQDARLLPWKTVLDNVRLGINGESARIAEWKAYEALKQVGLEDRAGDWPSVLSGGQRQRVALARALVGSPRLLLFDEPLGALDALTRIEMQRLIERLWEQRGFTAVLVTHDVSEAVALADRVVLIENGQVALDVPIMLDRPRTRDSSFARYEQLILDRVMATGNEIAQPTPETAAAANG